MFDFLKKKEFAIIASLKATIAQLEKNVSDLSQYQDIVDVDKALVAKKNELEELKAEYEKSYQVYLELKSQNKLFTESLEMAEFGMYDPHFEFDTSEKFKEAIVEIRDIQKQLIADDSAVVGGEHIVFCDSRAQGQAMVRQQKKLMLRAFNGECDSFIATVNWNNVQRLEARITKSFEAINRVYERQHIRLTFEYRDAKVEELRLTYEYKKKKYEEKEEQREIRERMREEEKVLREIEAAKIKAEKEEIAYQKALEKARKEIQTAIGEKQEVLLKQISELESRLAEAEQNQARALSMAQQTRRGHVYVISNIGSFGENVFKIGMTRRLEPMDRVRELGDASVPFSFDVHALIFSDDAPSLENTLHKAFDNKRVNMVNQRREFFCVTLSEIEEMVIKNHGSIEFTKIAEAEQYRETIAIKNRLSQSMVANDAFPAQL